MAILRVLVVEDDHAQFLIISRLLHKLPLWRLELAEANTLAAALDHLAASSFDAILLDLGLPDSEGFNTLRGIMGRCGAAAVIVLTARDDLDTAFQMVQQGAQDYLPKGRIDTEGLARAIRHAVERKRITEALASSERFIRSTLNALRTQIAILDGNGVIIDVNQAWRDFGERNGLRLQDHGVGTNYFEICRRAAAQGYNCAGEVLKGLQAVVSGTRSECYAEYPCHAPDERRWFSFRATRFDREGSIGVVVAHENITGRVVAEQLRRERQALTDAIEAQERVIGVLGHELRTPLAALRATTELLTTERLTGDQQAQFISSINSEVLRMGDFVNNMLEATRMNSGLAQWHWSRFAIGGICDAAMQTIRPLLNESPSSVHLHVWPADLQMTGDADAIRRLVINLLHNAIRHTHDDRIRLRIRQLEENGRRSVILRISDAGEGMPPHVIEKLGQPFALNAGIIGDKHIRGSGLGLAICKGIIEAHGGRMVVRSVVGRGTTITVRLAADLPAPMNVKRPVIPECAT